MSADLAALKTELIELDRQLQQAALHPEEGSDRASSRSSQLAALKQRLDDRLATLDGSAWQLLFLEWRYDFALLFDHACQWMDQVDASFSTEPGRKA